jgi:hypothetical protein
MATQLDNALTAERERIQPFVEELKRLVLKFDPDATFSPLQVGHVPEFWEFDARVRPDLAEDDGLHDSVADKTTDLLLDHDAAITMVLLPRDRQPVGD